MQMALEIYSILSPFTIGLPVLVAIILWLTINSISKTLDVDEEKKKKISLFSGIFLFGWFALAMILSSLELFHVSPEFISPFVPIFFIVPILFGLHLMRTSPTFRKLIDAFPQHILIILQLFRVLGIVFLLLLMQNQLPELFAIPTGWGDILIGITAPIIAYIYLKKFSFAKNLTIIWNILGIIDLLIAISLGILLSLPGPFNVLQTEISTEIMTLFPLVIVPAFAVPLGILLHIFSLKKLLKKK